MLDAAFYRVGVWGIPLSTSIVNIAGSPRSSSLLRSRAGGAVLEGSGRSLAGVLAASALLAVVAYPVWCVLDDALGHSTPAQIVSLGVALAAGVLVYLATCRVLRVREMHALLSLRSRPARR